MIANGNIQEYDDVQKNIDITTADGVMSAGNLYIYIYYSSLLLSFVPSSILSLMVINIETILVNPALFSGKIIHPCDMSNEYLDLCETKYPTQLKFIRTHLLNILKDR